MPHRAGEVGKVQNGDKMTQDRLLQAVRNSLPNLRVVSVVHVQRSYRVLQSQARQVIQDLQEAGAIGKAWDPKLGGYPVMMKG